MPMLTLLRHAKSAYPLGVGDHQRPLNERGRLDAPVAGQVLARGPHIDVALVSDAVRAQQTWELAGEALPDVPVRTEPRLYHASVSDFVNVLSELPDDIGHAVVVAHNPGLEELAMMMTRPSDTAAYEAMCTKFPTSAIALITFDGSWVGIASQFRLGELVEFAVPRG